MVRVIVITFIATLVAGMPVAFVLGISAAVALAVWGRTPMLVIAQRMFTGIDQFPLMAIPFFILAGEMMNTGGITRGLLRFSDALVGHIRGGLAQVNIVASMLFAGITGAAVADTSALGSILIPAMIEEGYDVDFSAAVTAASSVVGPIIPPSIPAVIYAVTAGISIGGLFLAGFAPGILFGLGMMLVAYFISKKRGYPRRETPITLRQFLDTFKRAVLALVMPLIILGGVLSGVFTPTEAAAIAVAYGLVVGLFITRELKLKDLPGIMIRAGLTTSMILLVVACASILSWVLSTQKIPAQIAAFFLSLTTNPLLMLFIVNIFLLMVGCVMDTSAAIIILVPILAPMMESLGIHPLHFGCIMVVNLCIGLATPPVGLCLFVACGISKIGLEDITREIWPFIAVEILVLFIITYFPAIPMFLPKMMGLY
jgi:tripartite ATP-independent transporter DctM subunit